MGELAEVALKRLARHTDEFSMFQSTPLDPGS